MFHLSLECFSELNLQWFCVPGVSNMVLDCGGIQYCAAPFNGWYMGTEIGRDLADSNRFDKIKAIGESMKLDLRNESSLWKDKALIELNYAILYSFQVIQAFFTPFDPLYFSNQIVNRKPM